MADWAKTNPELIGIVLDEAQRQREIIAEHGNELQTKVGLYLVFAVFAFTAQLDLVGAGQVGGLVVDVWIAIASAVLVLASILLLLWATTVRGYKMPPLVDAFREQTIQMAETHAKANCSPKESCARIQDKLIKSLARSVSHNYGINEEVALKLKIASVLLALAIGLLVLSVVLPAVRSGGPAPFAGIAAPQTPACPSLGRYCLGGKSDCAA